MSEEDDARNFSGWLLVGGWICIVIGLSMWSVILGIVFLGAGMLILGILIAANESLDK